MMGMLEYALKYHQKLLKALLQHMQIVGITLALSILLAILLTAAVIESRKLSGIVMHLCSMLYYIPSLALFALLIPLTGIGTDTAVIVLVIYNQYILVRNFVEGLQRVDPAVIDAARGMGMTGIQIFRKVRLPLALDCIVAGIRLSIVSTIGIATIGASIGAGGLGTILFDGMRTMNTAKILWGIVLSVGLVLASNGLLSLAEKKIRYLIYREER